MRSTYLNHFRNAILEYNSIWFVYTRKWKCKQNASVLCNKNHYAGIMCMWTHAIYFFIYLKKCGNEENQQLNLPLKVRAPAYKLCVCVCGAYIKYPKRPLRRRAPLWERKVSVAFIYIPIRVNRIKEMFWEKLVLPISVNTYIWMGL